MKDQASHMKSSNASSLRLLPEIGLVDVADPLLSERLAGKVSEQLEAFAAQMRQGLLAASVAIGLGVMGELVDAEVAGPKGGEREVHLESYDTFASVDRLADHMVASMLAGLSGRRYERALERVGETVEAAASGTSQSSVRGRFITATAERLAEFRSRPLDDQRWLTCFVDGFDFAGHTMVGALGVTADGTKVPLGVVEGSTENKAVVRHLIAGLRDRGLDASEGTLFVLDGGKALSTAVRDVFGDQPVIARCRVHKERNVMHHLPEAERPWVRRKLRAAWANPNASTRPPRPGWRPWPAPGARPGHRYAGRPAGLTASRRCRAGATDRQGPTPRPAAPNPRRTARRRPGQRAVLRAPASGRSTAPGEPARHDRLGPPARSCGSPSPSTGPPRDPTRCGPAARTAPETRPCGAAT